MLTMKFIRVSMSYKQTLCNEMVYKYAHTDLNNQK